MILANIAMALLFLVVGAAIMYGAMEDIIEGMKETIDRQYGEIIELKSELKKEREEYNPMKNI